MFKNKTFYRLIWNTYNKTSYSTGTEYIPSKALNRKGKNLESYISRSCLTQQKHIKSLQDLILITKQTNKSFSRSMSSDAKSAAPSNAKQSSPKHTNRLSESKSPYLLQHAHNPVDWYPWGEEAFERARAENKLIFLSVGYSTCHWCHVMEHESFENEEVATIMNEHFINIKVDREERPDIDKIYMQFLLMTNGSGGWPMSVWLTPDLAPIVAGTYFPPVKRYGMPSFSMMLKNMAGKWDADRESLTRAGCTLIEAMQSALMNHEPSGTADNDTVEQHLELALNIYRQRYDETHGGFGSYPKFPEVSRLNFLFHSYIVTKDADILDMVLETLDHIGRGGINDHVFGGFARYAVDKDWHVPHFEKMLYDQGQLMAAYANAYKLTHKEDFLNYADNIFRYVMKDLRHPSGGFYAGEDADSLPAHSDAVKVEGAFYAWTWAEVKNAFEENEKRFVDVTAKLAFEIYTFHYGMLQDGNVKASSDPHGHLLGKNILIMHGTDEDTCSNFNITKEQLENVLTNCNEILHEIREKRPRPHLDTKIICGWNGLMLSGLSKLANCGSVKREEYIKAAKTLVDFARGQLFDAEQRRLLRSCYGKSVDDDALEKSNERIDGFLDDYAFLIKGLLDYYKASLDGGVLHWAKELQDIQDALFWDERNGAYFFSQANSPNVIVRLKEGHDGAEPSGNSVASRNLILLSHYFDDENYRKRAENVFKFFYNIPGFGHQLPEMMSARLLDEHGLDLVAVVGPDSADTVRFVEICRKFYIPGMIILHVDPLHPDTNASNQRIEKKFKMINGKTTVYICHDRVCQMPVTDPEKLEEKLMQNFFRESI